MMTKDTLEIINTDLDAEMEERVNDRNLNVKNLKRLNPSIENPRRINQGHIKQKRNDPSIGNRTRINQGQTHHECNDSHLPKVNREETEHMKLFKKIILFFDLVGIIFGTKFKLDWKSHTYVMVWLTSFGLIFFWFSLFRDQFIHCRNDDYIRILEAFAVYGMGISCAQKWIGCLTKYKKIAALIYSVRKLCRENPVGSRAEIIKRGLQKTITMLKTFSIGVIASIAISLILPIKSYFVDGVFIPLLPLSIFFCDQSTLKGVMATSIIHAFYGMQYALATIMYTSAFLVSICYYTVQVDLVGEDFKDLDRMWDGSSTTSVSYSFLDAVKDLYRDYLFIYFCCNYFSQIVCLFEITKNSWLPGIPLAVILFIEMMFYCLVGTQISVAREKLSAIIYNTNWHDYDIKSQRVMMVILHDSQQPREIIIGTIGPLNVVTFIAIVKSIYSYYTVLKELF